MLKFSRFGWGYLTSNDTGEQTNRHDLHEFYALSSSIDRVSFKSNSMSLGLVLLQEKMYMHTRTQMQQSDTIIAAD